MFKIFCYVYFYYLLWKFNVNGSLRFENNPNCHWFAKHNVEVVTLNILKVNSFRLVRQKLTHEVWHLCQLRDDKEKLLLLKQLRPTMQKLGIGSTYEFLMPSEIDARSVEKFGYPIGLFDDLDINDLLHQESIGSMLQFLQQLALMKLEYNIQLAKDLDILTFPIPPNLFLIPIVIETD